MKILYVVGTCLTKNTSANMSHNAYIKGMVENGCNVDIIMENDSWGSDDEKLKRFPECNYFEYNSVSFLDKIRNKFSYAEKGKIPTEVNAESKSNENIVNNRISFKQKIRSLLKQIFYFIFRSDPLYPLNKTWLKNAQKYKSVKTYDLVVSNSSPAASHKLVELLLNKGRISCKRWIQIWEDPWYYDIYGGNPERIKKEEELLLQKAQEIYYVSPLTLMYQKKFFSDCANKMKCIPLPFYEYTDNKELRDKNNISFGYFGDYYSHTRNLRPFYEALVESKCIGYVYGDSDEGLKSTNLIDISGRVTLDKLAEIQDKTTVLVNLCNLKGGQIPGKIYHYSATNKPILFILDGTEDEIKEIYDFFSQFNRYYFCRNDKESILNAINLISSEKDKIWDSVKEFAPENVVKAFL